MRILVVRRYTQSNPSNRPFILDSMYESGLLVAALLPWLNPFSPGPTPQVVQSLVSLICVALLFLAYLRPMDLVSLVRLSARAWLIAALVSSAIGLLQYYGTSAVFTPWINSEKLGEAIANLRQRNQFATLTNMDWRPCFGVSPATGGHSRRLKKRHIHPWSPRPNFRRPGLSRLQCSWRLAMQHLLLAQDCLSC